MSSDRDVDRIVRSWLDEGVTALPDPVLDAVLDQLPTTPQRRAWWPARRFADMNNFAKLAIGAAAVLVVVVVGSFYLSGRNVGAPGPANPSPTPSTTPTTFRAPGYGPVEVGVRYSVDRDVVPYSFSVPTTGWLFDQYVRIYKDGPDIDALLYIRLETPDNVYADPCAHTPLEPAAGSSAADLVEALAEIPGTDIVRRPSDVTVGGRSAKLVAFTVPEDVGCNVGDYYLWYTESSIGDCPGPGCLNFGPTAAGETLMIWIVDVSGETISFEAEIHQGASPEVVQEIQQIIDSIRFE